ncbi:c-type cytochrome [Longitalea arenae]|uniref:c-type cytochrome n=1 Tax=Longitalea arenae TaxID=2812558 RepID=UPI001F07A578|nr:cytochrome c [Longitalea arenae]
MSMIVFSCNSHQTSYPESKTEHIRQADTTGWPARFGLGRPASAAGIAAMDIDVSPDGTGLPPGEGKAEAGKTVYMNRCVACHGTETTPGDAKLLGPVLISNNPGKAKTIGNYWPYATTLFDYVRRAMPYNEPGTLSDEEVYQVTAFLLAAAKVIRQQDVLNAQTLPNIKMPARERFVPDDRKGGPEVR